ncbi:MAG: dethiobiotin synthase [Chitinispirillaceae bacterium]|nr:dethiobiotin synthase [Chitinispirillaceae bacterium]
MDKRPALFVTATDTGIGKTYISRIITDYSGSQQKTSYMKPVQTGCTRGAEEALKAPDFDTVMEGTAVMNGTYEQHVPYRFEPACSPHLAAALAGRPISLDHIRDCFLTISDKMSLVVVEGAGGILTPLAETTFIIDLIVYLKLPVIVVTSPRIGTLNHTFLTLRVLHESGVRVAGVVFNYHNNVPASFVQQENRRMIEAHTHPIPFLEVPFGGGNQQSVKDFVDAIIKGL